MNRNGIIQLALEALALKLGRETKGLSEQPFSCGMLTDGHTLYVLEYDVKKHTFSISQSRFYKSNEMVEICVWLLGQLLKVYPHKSLVRPGGFCIIISWYLDLVMQ